MPVSLSKKGPGVGAIGERLAQLKKSDVLVGIPASAAMRPGEKMNNASLMFLLTNGSALRGIPPTPILEPSVEANRKIITPHLAAAAQAVLEENPERAQDELNKAGIIAANGAKRWFTDPNNGWPPNRPSTIKKKGSDKRNIDKGALRRAITHIVRLDGKVQAPLVVAVEEAEVILEPLAEI